MSNKGQFKYKDIGGQAVMEGVMMQSPSDEAMAIAVRRPNGRIMVTCEHREPLSKRHPWMGLPLVRGCVNMVVMLKMGMETLGISLMTNMAAGILEKKLDHKEVLEEGEKAKERFSSLLEGISKRWSEFSD